MTVWTGIALALTAPGGDEMRSRLSTYLHPLAGRPLVWHTVSALASLRPAPAQLIVLSRAELHAELFHGLPVPVRVLYPEDEDLWSAFTAGSGAPQGNLLLANGAAPVIGPELQKLLAYPPAWILPGTGGEVAAALLAAEEARALLMEGGTLAPLASDRSPPPGYRPRNALVVRTRAQLARAAQVLRDRIVRYHLEQGVSFHLPETVLVDVDVRIGRDSIIYPGVVIEGQSNLGDETVIGPGCRIINSRIGSGVELKGWNYISHTFVRNRAILEPYVRRGFD